MKVREVLTYGCALVHFSLLLMGVNNVFSNQFGVSRSSRDLGCAGRAVQRHSLSGFFALSWFGFKTIPHLLRLFRRTTQHCFAARLLKRSPDYETSPHFELLTKTFNKSTHQSFVPTSVFDKIAMENNFRISQRLQYLPTVLP